MHFLFTDETNQQPTSLAEFFIYGGIFAPAERLSDLHNLVETARLENGYKPSDQFKFNIAEKPSQVSKEQFTKAKRLVLDGCGPLGVQFSAVLTLHEIAKNKELEQLIGWGANTVIGAFNRFLSESSSFGVCIVDRLPFRGGFAYLEEKFRTGLTFPQGKTIALDRIQLFAATCEGASHASSVADIVLGSFRYCVNQKEKDIAPREMLPIIARMMWHWKDGNRVFVRERGLIFRPKRVAVEAYQHKYDELVERFTRLLQ